MAPSSHTSGASTCGGQDAVSDHQQTSVVRSQPNHGVESSPALARALQDVACIVNPLLHEPRSPPCGPSSASSLTPGLRLLPSPLSAAVPRPPVVVLERSSRSSILTHSFLFTTLFVFHSLLHTLARDYILGLNFIFERVTLKSLLLFTTLTHSWTFYEHHCMLSDLRHCGVRQDGRPARAWQSMNTTMAPLDQIRQGSLGEVKRRHDPSHRSLLRRKDDDEKDKNERDDNDGRGKRDDDSDEEEEGNKGGVRKNEDDDDDERRPQQNPTLLPPPPPPQVVSTMTVPGAAAEPTTVVVVSTLTAPPSVSTVWMTTSVTATPAIPSSPPVPTSSTMLPSSSISAPPSNVRNSRPPVKLTIISY
ncbi:hypothetical protein DL98DRAFT_508073 [Cadophora sp. DSE1049]|nr:hypothetical protein DL98DRAFT_508073 [Cadophora sp. DSE1049]